LVAERPREGVRTAIALGVFVLIGVPTTCAMRQYTISTVEDVPGLIMGSRSAVLRPEKWSGSRFPLLDWIDCGDQLRNGTWEVRLVNMGCSNCLAEIKRCSTAVRHGNRLAFVEVPPFRDFSTQDLLPADGAFLFCRLPEDRVGYARLPIKITIRDGTVLTVDAPE